MDYSINVCNGASNSLICSVERIYWMAIRPTDDQLGQPYLIYDFSALPGFFGFLGGGTIKACETSFSDGFDFSHADQGKERQKQNEEALVLMFGN